MTSRGLDVLLAAAGLLLLWPLMLAAAIGIRLEGGGPVLFLQTRVGRGERPFTIFKFRTMRPTTGDASALHGNMDRVSSWGRLLRSSKIDELPQLLNVIRGDMSLVGPRPELPHYVSLWSAADRAVVLSVRPGITDFASLAYRREEQLLSRQSDPETYYRRIILPRKLRLARFYVARTGAGLNLWLIGQTVAVLAGLPARLSRLSPRETVP